MIKLKTINLHQLTKYSKLITLPKFWTKMHNLTEQDKVLILVDDNKDLVIRPYKVNENAT
jgi:antitoxin component of MazEF toxin-antitoxin module